MGFNVQGLVFSVWGRVLGCGLHSPLDTGVAEVEAGAGVLPGRVHGSAGASKSNTRGVHICKVSGSSPGLVLIIVDGGPCHCAQRWALQADIAES